MGSEGPDGRTGSAAYPPRPGRHWLPVDRGVVAPYSLQAGDLVLRGHGERYDHGHLSRVTLHPPMYGMNFGAVFAW